jgi:hypothetical protein
MVVSTGQGIRGYQEFLTARDGEADLARHTLSRREAFFADLAGRPVRSTAPIERDAYLRNVVKRRPDTGLDARVVWLLASAKANQAERFAIGLAELYGRIPGDGDGLQVHIHLQETYHTRILADVVAIFGLPAPLRPPPMSVRLMVKWLITVPEAARLPVAGMAEMAGCVIFRALRDRGLELFADEPAVAERIRLLYDQILADEIGHVGFIAARLGPGGRALTRTLYRMFGRRLVAQMPELVASVGRERLEAMFHGPFLVDAMAAEFPGLAFAAASI